MIKPLPMPVISAPEPMITIPPGIFDPVVLDPYKLPPILSIPGDCLEASLPMLDYCTSKQQRVHWAAAIILGQPFNRRQRARN